MVFLTNYANTFSEMLNEKITFVKISALKIYIYFFKFQWACFCSNRKDFWKGKKDVYSNWIEILHALWLWLMLLTSGIIFYFFISTSSCLKVSLDTSKYSVHIYQISKGTQKKETCYHSILKNEKKVMLRVWGMRGQYRKSHLPKDEDHHFDNWYFRFIWQSYSVCVK